MAEKANFKPFTIDNVRAVDDYARSYLWDVLFPEAPDPFKLWFPANDLDEQLYAVESATAEFFNIAFNFPKKLILPKITLTFYDREDRINFKWIRSWIAQTIFNLNIPGVSSTVSPLEEVVKEMIVMKLRHDKSVIDFTSYWVYPESLSDRGTSNNEASIFSVPFVVAGMNVRGLPNEPDYSLF